MGDTFRASMTWLHTWAGVVLGALLFAIFLMGTLSVFDREIDRWMMPDTRLALPVAPYPLDPVAERAEALAAPQSPFWQLRLPTPREPVVRLGYRTAGGAFVTRYFDPTTGALLPEPGTLAGTGFIFPFHYRLFPFYYRLHLRWQDLGYWLVGLAGMSMLALLVSGVVIHRKIFRDFFTFRRERKLPRSDLDLHNLTGVLGLPFHFVMTLSGLIIFSSIYFPGVIDTVYQGDRAAFFQDAYGRYERQAAGTAGAAASLDRMVARATNHWGEPPYLLRMYHPGDANAYVQIRRTRETGVSLNNDVLYFDAASGELLKSHTASPAVQVQRFIAGIHFIQFDHWPLRWLYFVLGLSGCVMIATGYIYWLETRRKRHAKQGLPGVRIVEGLTVGSVTGIVIATLAFLVFNRLLPLGATFDGYDRAALEAWVFYLVWLATFAHAWLRLHRAWREQCWLIAALALLAPVLNGITTGDHLAKTLADGYWPVAGMDLVLLAGAGIAVAAAGRLARGRGDAREAAGAPATAARSRG